MLKVTEIGLNMFQFMFQNIHDKGKVLNGRPWACDNQPMVILSRKEGFEVDNEAFNKTWIWVRIWNLPIHWITKDAAKR